MISSTIAINSNPMVIPAPVVLRKSLNTDCFCLPADGLTCTICYSKRINEVRSQIMLWSTIVGTTMSSQVATVQQLCGHLCSDIPSSSSSGLETLEMTIAQMAVSTSHLQRQQIQMIKKLETNVPITTTATPQMPHQQPQKLPVVLLPLSQQHQTNGDSDINVGISSSVSSTPTPASSTVNISERSFPCPDPDGRCGERFPTEAHASLHYRRMHNSDSADTLRQYACTHCTASYAQQRFLERHLRVGHKNLNNNQIIVQQSSTASAISHADSSLLKRTRVVANNSTTTSTIPLLFPCNDLRCPFTTQFAQNQLIHFNTVHQKPRHEFRCNLCSASYKSSGGLQQHSLRHQSSANSGSASVVAIDLAVPPGKRGRPPKSEPAMHSKMTSIPIAIPTSSNSPPFVEHNDSNQAINQKSSLLTVTALPHENLSIVTTNTVVPILFFCRDLRCPHITTVDQNQKRHFDTVHHEPRHQFRCHLCSASYQRPAILNQHLVRHTLSHNVDSSRDASGHIDIGPVKLMAKRGRWPKPAPVILSVDLPIIATPVVSPSNTSSVISADHGRQGTAITTTSLRSETAAMLLMSFASADSNSSSVSDLNTDASTAIDSVNIPMVRCRVWQCPLRFSSKSSEIIHNNTVHSKPRKSYRCLDCSASFSLSGLLTSHALKHMEWRPDTVANRAVADSSLTLNPGVSNSVLLDVIESDVDDSESNVDEDDVVPIIGSRLYPCRVISCPETFVTRCGELYHQRGHTQNYTDKCEQCGASYKMHAHLANHILKHAIKDTRVTPAIMLMAKIPSSHVNQGERSSINVQDDDNENGGDDDMDGGGMHPCRETLCPETFPTRWGEIHHRRGHTQNFAHQCEHCGASYKQPGQLANHLLKHTMKATVVGRDTTTNAMDTDSIDTDIIDIDIIGPTIASSFPCRVANCPESYTSSKFELRHNEKHHQSHNVNACTQCSASYGSAKWLTQHLRKHDEVSKPVSASTTSSAIFQCHVLKCPETFDSSIAADQHLKVHSAPDDYHRCQHCSAAYASPVLLDMHTLKHGVQFLDDATVSSIKNTTSSHTSMLGDSEECAVTYNDPELNLLIPVHVSDIDSWDKVSSSALMDDNTAGMFKCRVANCPEYYTTAHSEHCHNQKHHETQSINACSQCGASYAAAYALARHRNKHVEASKSVSSDTTSLSLDNSNRVPGTIPCSVPRCPETFNSRPGEKYHHRSNHIDTFYNEQCQQCGAGYHTLAKLSRHMVKHVGQFDFSELSATEANYRCPVVSCPERFRSAEASNHHGAIHSTTAGICYSCDVCNAAYDSTVLLNLHMLKHTNAITTETIDNTITSSHDDMHPIFATDICNTVTSPTDSLPLMVDMSAAPTMSANLESSNMGIHPILPFVPPSFAGSSRVDRISSTLMPDSSTSSTYPCRVSRCPETFNSHFSENYHNQTNHINANGEQCQQCGAAYSKHVKLTRHLLKHVGLFDFSEPTITDISDRCPVMICPELLCSVEAANSGIDFRCGVCNVGYDSSVLLHTHMFQHNDATVMLSSDSGCIGSMTTTDTPANMIAPTAPVMNIVSAQLTALNPDPSTSSLQNNVVCEITDESAVGVIGTGKFNGRVNEHVSDISDWIEDTDMDIHMPPSPIAFSSFALLAPPISCMSTFVTTESEQDIPFQPFLAPRSTSPVFSNWD